MNKGIFLRDGKINTDFKQVAKNNCLEFGNIFDFDYNLIVKSVDVKIDDKLIKYGFEFLENWQVIAPLRPYSELICKVISDTFHDYLKNKIIDLRVPVYDDRIIFIKTCDDSRNFWDTYLSETNYLKNSNVAFSLALWEIKPLILTLPVGWVK
jgi:6-pyruvoyl-tetrahydropterin synthase